MLHVFIVRAGEKGKRERVSAFRAGVPGTGAVSIQENHCSDPAGRCRIARVAVKKEAGSAVKRILVVLHY
jgi:hypothetical protein